MPCSHTRQTKKAQGWVCKACGAVVPHHDDTPIVEKIRSVQTHVDGDLDLTGAKYRFQGRTGSGFAEDRKEMKRCAEMREAERQGGKKREADGLRHTMSIPTEVYWGARKKYGDGFLQDKKIKRKLHKHFSVTADGAD